MKSAVCLFLIVLVIGCTRPNYIWTTSDGKLAPVVLNIEVDPESPYKDTIKELYPQVIQSYLKAWMPMAGDEHIGTGETVKLNLYISCHCNDGWKLLGSMIKSVERIRLDNDKYQDIYGTPTPEEEQAERLGYNAFDIKGRMTAVGPVANTSEIKSRFEKSDIMKHMDPLSADARIDKYEIHREEARGLARYIVSTLRLCGLAYQTPKNKDSGKHSGEPSKVL